ncbi:hypothetical protein IKG49_00515 [Candidatus Saccharibacteria bacterium]|nr:hypothetical protein [Candidatus Saccharibacteria bacterium]
MGVIVNKQDDKDSELSKRISADLRTRVVNSAEDKDVDLADDAEYMKDLKKTGRFGWIWPVLIILALLSLISIILI